MSDRTCIGTYNDDQYPSLSIEWWEGFDGDRRGRWLYRRLVIPPTLNRQSAESDRVALALGGHISPFTPNGGHHWTRPSDGCTLVLNRIFSLN